MAKVSDFQGASLKRVIEYLREADEAVTPTQIATETRLPYGSVLGCIEFLDSVGLIGVQELGRIRAISWKPSKIETAEESS